MINGQVGDILHTVGITLIHTLWIGGLWGVLGFVVLLALRKAAPQTRYLSALFFLTILALIPVVLFPLSFRDVTAPTEKTYIMVPSEVAKKELWHMGPDGRLGPMPDQFTITLPEPLPVHRIDSQTSERLLPTPSAASDPQWTTWLRLRSTTLEKIATPLSPWLALFWIGGIILLSIRFTVAARHIRRLRVCETAPLPAPLQGVVHELCETAGIRRTVIALRSMRAQVPMVVGWFAPVILVPAEVLTGLSPEQLRLVLAHELAHIKRLDPLVNLLQVVVETVLFYHPTVWWLSRELRHSREHCCDDLALSWCGHPVEYAHALVHVAERAAPTPTMALSATGKPLRRRVERILAGPIPQTSAAPALAPLVALTLPCLVLSGLVWAELGLRDSMNSGDPIPQVLTIGGAVQEAEAKASVPAEPALEMVARDTTTTVESPEHDPQPEQRDHGTLETNSDVTTVESPKPDLEQTVLTEAVDSTRTLPEEPVSSRPIEDVAETPMGDDAAPTLLARATPPEDIQADAEPTPTASTNRAIVMDTKDGSLSIDFENPLDITLASVWKWQDNPMLPLATELPPALAVALDERFDKHFGATTVEALLTYLSDGSGLKFSYDPTMGVKTTSSQSILSAELNNVSARNVIESLLPPAGLAVRLDAESQQLLIVPGTTEQPEAESKPLSEKEIYEVLQSPVSYSMAYALSLRDLLDYMETRYGVDIRIAPEVDQKAISRIGKSRGRARGISDNDGGTLAEILAASTDMAGLGYTVNADHLQIAARERKDDPDSPSPTSALSKNHVPVANMYILATRDTQTLEDALRKWSPRGAIAVWRHDDFESKTSPPAVVARRPGQKITARESAHDVLSRVANSLGLIRYTEGQFVVATTPERLGTKAQGDPNSQDGFAASSHTPIHLHLEETPAQQVFTFLEGHFGMTIPASAALGDTTLSIDTTYPSLAQVIAFLTKDTRQQAQTRSAEPSDPTPPEVKTISQPTSEGIATIPVADGDLPTYPDKASDRLGVATTSHSPHMNQVLNTSVNLEFEDIELGDILNFVTRSYNVQVFYLPAVEAETPLKTRIVPYIRLRDRPLGEALSAILQPLGLRYWTQGDNLIVGEPRLLDQLSARGKALWPALPTLRVTENVENEHICTILDRWGKSLGIYFHVDPYVVAAPGATTTDYPDHSHGMVRSLTLDNQPLPEALDQLLAPLGLAYWYGRPGPDKGATPIHPSVWIGTPRTVERIAGGVVTRFSVEAALCRLDPIAYEAGYLRLRSDANRNRPNADQATVRVTLPDGGADVHPSAMLKEAIKALGVPTAGMELISAPRVTTRAGNDWWPSAAGVVSTLALVNHTASPPSQTLKIRTAGLGGCLVRQRPIIPDDWNPFKLNKVLCGPGMNLEIPPSISVVDVDTLLPGAAAMLGMYEYPAFIADYTEVFDPPLLSPEVAIPVRAGRRKDTVPRKRARAHLNDTTEVRHYHEGFLVGVQALTRDNGRVAVNLTSQFRPGGSGPVPWKGILTRMVVDEGTTTVLEYPSADPANHLLLLIRVQADDRIQPVALSGEQSLLKFVLRGGAQTDPSPFIGGPGGGGSSGHPGDPDGA